MAQTVVYKNYSWRPIYVRYLRFHYLTIIQVFSNSQAEKRSLGSSTLLDMYEKIIDLVGSPKAFSSATSAGLCKKLLTEGKVNEIMTSNLNCLTNHDIYIDRFDYYTNGSPKINKFKAGQLLYDNNLTANQLLIVYNYYLIFKK